MKPLKNYLFKILIIILLIFLIFLIINFTSKVIIIKKLSKPNVNFSDAKKDFEDNKKEILLVRNYLSELKYDSIFIDITLKDKTMQIMGEDKEIENKTVAKAIRLLERHGYIDVTKDKNYIAFLRWSNLDNGMGYVYSINGSEPMLQFLTKLEPLSEPNWYYYEEDFNEWKRRNTMSGQNVYVPKCYGDARQVTY